MRYLSLPREITVNEIYEKGFSFSPGMYGRVVMPNRNSERLINLLEPRLPYEKGFEPGSFWYARKSPKYFIRNRALQEDTYLIYTKGESVVPVNPKVFKDFELSNGDILLSKDSNIGEVAMVDGDNWKNYMFSSGIVRINPLCDRFYLFAFLKHPFFKAQLCSMTPKGATITHAKDIWQDCLVPLPVEDGDRIIKIISGLASAIFETEVEIKKKYLDILEVIEGELTNSQKPIEFSCAPPSVSDLSAIGRFDASIYSEDVAYLKFLTENYKNRSDSISSLGFKIVRGQNLQVSCIGKSIYSDIEKSGFYRLVIPTNIGDYGTVLKFKWLGNKNDLELVKEGDIIFGSEATYRSTVVCDGLSIPTITNIHASILRNESSPLSKKVACGMWLNFLRTKGFFGLISAGGHGGSVPIRFLEEVRIPRFPEKVERRIFELYHNPTEKPETPFYSPSFLDTHREYNRVIGIYQLGAEAAFLKAKLHLLQEAILEGSLSYVKCRTFI